MRARVLRSPRVPPVFPAPRKNPKIAIAVYVEHGGFGSEIAVPIASLIEEQYLTDTIKRPYLVDYVKRYKIDYPRYKAKK